MTKHLDPDRMLPSEALTAFVGWLTTRRETLFVGAKYESSEIAELLRDFIIVNELRPVRDEFTSMPVRFPHYPN